jgi:uncharacterized Zn-binding protein involved in type VI secretion
MPGFVQRVGDANQVGGVILEGDPTVLVNGRPVATIGDSVSPHFCCGVPHCPPIHCSAETTATSATVLVGGKPICVTGDIDTCGHSRVLGSTNVIVG